MRWEEPRNARDHEGDKEELEGMKMLSGGGERRAVHVVDRMTPTVEKFHL
jgi:hypothetical protein